MKELRNLNLTKALPLITVRSEFNVICNYNLCAAFMLRLFEVEHMRLFDNWSLSDSYKHEAFETAIIQKWTRHKIKEGIGGVYKERWIPEALKTLHELGFIKWEHAKENGLFKGHNVTFLLENVQKAIIVKQKEIHGIVENKDFINVVEKQKERKKLKKLIAL